jgi:hypothetical protein
MIKIRATSSTARVPRPSRRSASHYASPISSRKSRGGGGRPGRLDSDRDDGRTLALAVPADRYEVVR